jgi:hypothetical protein
MAAPTGPGSTSIEDAAAVTQLRRNVESRARYRFTQKTTPGVTWDRYRHTVEQLLDEHLASILPVYQDTLAIGGAVLDNAARFRRRQQVAVAVTLAVAVGAAVLGLSLGSTPGAIAGALAVALVGGVAIGVLQRQQQQAEIELVSHHGGSVRGAQLDEVVDQTILDPAESRALAVEWGDPATEQVTLTDGAELSTAADTDQTISTEASRRVALALSRRFGSAVGLAGPRGVGKTEIARSFTSGETWPNARIFLSAPVNYEARTFLLRVLKELCTKVLGPPGWDAERRRRRNRRLMWTGQALVVATGAGLVVGALTGFDIRKATYVEIGVAVASIGVLLPFARRWLRSGPRWLPSSLSIPASQLLRQIEFTETVSSSAEFGLGVRGLTGKRTTGSSMVRTALSEVDVVVEFKGLVETIAGLRGQVVVGIDELDKIPSDKEAVEFLNHVKALFDTKNCSFIVSVSETAWAQFESRGGLPFRDAFDSSLDEVITVGVLRPAESRDLLRRRSVAVTDMQALFCHCLSAGVPRDLLRAARRLAQSGDASADRSFAAVAEVMLAEDVATKVTAAELRVRTADADGRYPAVLADVARWASAWPDVDPLLGPLHAAGFCRTPVDDSDTAFRLASAVQDLSANVAILQTVGQAFAAGGPAASLAARDMTLTDPFITDGFGAIARAGRALSLSAERAVEQLAGARTVLGLTPPKAPSSRRSRGSPSSG